MAEAQTPQHSTRSHSTISPSSASRWVNCPGSVLMASLVPPPAESPYAAEGTRAHEIVEYCIKHDVDDPASVVAFAGEDEDTLDAVRTHLAYVRPQLSQAAGFGVEQRVAIPLGSTAIAGIVDLYVLLPLEGRDGLLLRVIDYKHGQGVPVEAVGNYQLALYAYGCLLSLPVDVRARVREIDCVISQPRARHVDGSVRVWNVPIEDLIEIIRRATEAAERIAVGDKTLNAGPHCRWCPALAVCPEAAESARKLAQQEFADVALLSDQQVADNLAFAVDFIEPWIRALRSHVQQKLEAGEQVRGWKLVQKRAVRRWVDEARVVEWARKMRLRMADIYEKSLISPAAMERLVGKKHLPAELVVSESSGVTIARDVDPRTPQTVETGSEFFVD